MKNLRKFNIIFLIFNFICFLGIFESILIGAPKSLTILLILLFLVAFILFRLDLTEIKSFINSNNSLMKTVVEQEEVIKTISKKNEFFTTQMQQLSTDLKAADEKFLTLLEATNDAILILSNNKINDCNSIALQLFSCDRGQLLGSSLTDYFPVTQDCGNNSIEKYSDIFLTINKEKALTFEWSLITRSGFLFPCDITMTKVILKDKEFIQTIIRDRTEWKLNEEELITYREHLEDLVDDRTKELEQAKQTAEKAFEEISAALEGLKIAKMEAEEATKVKSQFLANISHELRTPLNCIIGFSEMLEDTNSFDLVKGKSKDILREAEMLLDLVNTILDHSKIEAGKMELDCYPINLPQLFSGLEDTLGAGAKIKGLDFIIEVDPKVSDYVLGDTLRLRQILTNLMSNAIKFTAKGLVKTIIEIAEETEKTVSLRFSVVDTGIGIPEEKQEIIFESFTQADNSMTRQYGGTGLGTTISQELVSLMHGTIGLTSEMGKGSVFWFVVPFKKYNSRLFDHSDQSTDSENILAQQFSANVLVVEDYLKNQELAAAHLESVGITVSVANNGLEAVELCQKNKFDLIIMDVQMPKMNGFDATMNIRKEGLCIDTPILGMTANADELSLQMCYKAGMNNVITKPVRKALFIEAISKLLV